MHIVQKHKLEIVLLTMNNRVSVSSSGVRSMYREVVLIYYGVTDHWTALPKCTARNKIDELKNTNNTDLSD